MRLQGPRVVIRPMTRADIDAMIQWRPFADPLYQPFDFPRRDRSEQVRWYEWRSRDPTRLLYTVENEGSQVIGSLTLRDIDARRSARLGITIGADFVSQGYGKEAIELFLGYFFGELAFARMVLDVAATNLRAVHTYHSLGFRHIGEHYQPATHASYRILQREVHYRHLRRFFRRQGTVPQVLFYDMAMTREEWQARVQAASGAQT